MVRVPGDYPWSSVAANLGQRVDALIRPHAEYLALGNDDAMRQTNYSELVHKALEADLVRQIRESRDSGYPLASDGFKAALVARLGRKTEPGRPGRPGRQSESEPSGSPQIGL